ncbi:MAG: hypothetical protein IIA65_02015, partial [Planctomycetes bacterium]|nr:hypothetical protein [Planctomycetota bacterium]
RRIVQAIRKAFENAAQTLKNDAGQTGCVRFNADLKYESFRLSTGEPSVQTALQAVQAVGLKGDVRISNDVQTDGGNSTDVSFYEPWHNYTQNGYVGPKGNGRSANRSGVVQKTMQVKDPANLFVFADEGPFTQTGYNRVGLNDTRLYVIFGTVDAQNAMRQFKSQYNITTGPDGAYGEFTDIIAGFHNAPSGNVVAGKGNCAFVDGHVAAVQRLDSFAVSWPI